MQKIDRTATELLHELEEDRQNEADFENGLLDQMWDEHLTVEQALERLWVHLIDDHIGNSNQTDNAPESRGEM